MVCVTLLICVSRSVTQIQWILIISFSIAAIVVYFRYLDN